MNIAYFWTHTHPGHFIVFLAQAQPLSGLPFTHAHFPFAQHPQFTAAQVIGFTQHDDFCPAKPLFTNNKDANIKVYIKYFFIIFSL
jgi:hypothetical protein